MIASARPPVPADLIVTKADRKAIADGCYYDDAAARRVIAFIETFCCHTKGRWYGKPFRLLEWQRHFLRRIYGWKRPDGTRRFRQVYLEVPKKNGKTELLSALVLYHLIADREMAAEVYLCAYNRKQAKIIFEDAVMMVESSPDLADELVIKDSFHEKTIRFPATRSVAEVMSADAPSADGKSSSLTVFDELHRQKTPELWNVMEYAGSGREQPLLYSLTTAGVDRKSVCYQKHEHARKIIEGIDESDTSFLGIIWGADPEHDDLSSPAVWARVNPSWGETIRPDDFAEEYRRALEDPVQLNNFLRLRLNVWTSEESRFVHKAKWDACGQPFDPDELIGRPCYGGVDLSNTSDVTAFVLIFPWEGGYRVLCRFFLPKEYGAERQEKDGIPYLHWARRRLIDLTPGDTVDYGYIEAAILDAAGRYDVRSIYCDPYNATSITQAIADAGLPVANYKQHFTYMSPPCKELIRLVGLGLLRHGGNPVLDWMCDNVRVIQDGHENIKISKKHSKDKVDGMVALVIAIAAAMQWRPAPKAGISWE